MSLICQTSARRRVRRFRTIPTGPFEWARGDWAARDAGPVQHYTVPPCYVGLATLTAGYGGWFDWAILLLEEGGALTERDVTDVLGVPVVAAAPVDAAIARATDAGLLLPRLGHATTAFTQDVYMHSVLRWRTAQRIRSQT